MMIAPLRCIVECELTEEGKKAKLEKQAAWK